MSFLFFKTGFADVLHSVFVFFLSPSSDRLYLGKDFICRNSEFSYYDLIYDTQWTEEVDEMKGQNKDDSKVAVIYYDSTMNRTLFQTLSS